MQLTNSTTVYIHADARILSDREIAVKTWRTGSGEYYTVGYCSIQLALYGIVGTIWTSFRAFELRPQWRLGGYWRSQCPSSTPRRAAKPWCWGRASPLPRETMSPPLWALGRSRRASLSSWTTPRWRGRGRSNETYGPRATTRTASFASTSNSARAGMILCSSMDLWLGRVLVTGTALSFEL